MNCGIHITDHTQEMEGDMDRIIKEIVPMHYRVHIHCFSHTTTFFLRLPEYFPNLCIGVTGVCYATNCNNADLLKQMAANDNKQIYWRSTCHAWSRPGEHVWRARAKAVEAPILSLADDSLDGQVCM
ncbi:hypothetical protein EDD18DRAFT_1343245 [Armillaria luteobubalina]|uniref:Uncharacterized protein n=1 Tax=Armillaria luteobubalina TaxID=153913 RepID=A0AA39UX14_9AGAR|nr:hypothetical protein EDD18DRAFT_1343245 [Armillaria luteobubalina]